MIRVALLCPAPDPSWGQRDGTRLDDALHSLVLALPEQEFEVELAAQPASRLAALSDGLLRRRGFAAGLPGLPPRVARLVSGRYSVVHAFSPLDAVAAGLWRRATGGVSVLTWTEVPQRDRLADRRLKLPVLREAMRTSDAVRAESATIAAELQRWLAVEAPVLSVRDAAGHAQLYRELLTSRS